MAITIPSGAAEVVLQPPTAALPPMKALATIQPEELERCLAYLQEIYIPEVQASRRLRPKLKSLHQTSLSSTRSTDVLRGDAFERTYALRWLTTCLARVPGDENPIVEALLQSAAGLLAVCAGTASAGVLTRTFAFGDIRIEIADAPFENADFGTIGMQTWGGACVLSEMLVDEPARFFPSTYSRPLRVLELGAGTGLVSLTAAKLAQSAGFPALDIVASDKHASVLANLYKNITTNFMRATPIRPAPLDWKVFAGKPRQEQLNLDLTLNAPFDVIVGADIVYEAEHAEWIRACVAHFLRSSGQFHLVIPLRFGFDAEAMSVDKIFQATPGYRSLSIVRQETIVCEDDSKPVGHPGRELEYKYYIIEWVEA